MTGKPSKTGERLRLTIGLYECPKCNKKFRIAIGKETLTIKNMAQKIRGIEEGLTQTLRNLKERIKTLEKEKADLLEEIDELKKVADEKIENLEGEVGMLRKEAKALRDLLGKSAAT